MTISQLIKQLEDIKEKHGDVPVNVFEPYALGCGGLFETQRVLPSTVMITIMWLGLPCAMKTQETRSLVRKVDNLAFAGICLNYVVLFITWDDRATGEDAMTQGLYLILGLIPFVVAAMILSDKVKKGFK